MTEKVYCCDYAKEEEIDDAKHGDELSKLVFPNVTIYLCSDCFSDVQERMIKDDLHGVMPSGIEISHVKVFAEIFERMFRVAEDVIEEREQS